MFFATRKKGVLRGVFRGDRYKHIGQGLKMAGRGICGGVDSKGGFSFPMLSRKKSPRPDKGGGRIYPKLDKRGGRYPVEFLETGSPASGSTEKFLQLPAF